MTSVRLTRGTGSVAAQAWIFPANAALLQLRSLQGRRTLRPRPGALSANRYRVSNLFDRRGVKAGPEPLRNRAPRPTLKSCNTSAEVLSALMQPRRLARP